MANKVVGFLEWIGKAFEKGVTEFEKYEPEVAGIAGLVFPPAAAALKGVQVGVSLIQRTVVSIEQKYAAAGKQNGTGAQKLAEVLSIATPATLQLFAKEGVDVDAAEVEKITNVVVDALNAKMPPEAAAAP
jgi:hypothetical protein